MRRLPLLTVVPLLLTLAGCARPHPVVTMSTPLGDIFVELVLARAPVTAGNFLTHVDLQSFHGATFYRVVRDDNQPDNLITIAVIQGGIGAAADTVAPIAHETTRQTGIKHRDGTISMARNEPGSASTEIFICIGDQPELDYGGRRNPDGQGFAAFGVVVGGMDVVRAIHQLPAEGQSLAPPVPITAVVRQ